MFSRVFSIICTLSFFLIQSGSAGPPAVPKLTIVIIVDQMRDDYLSRFDDLYCTDGFHLLMQKGARYVNSSYPYSSTFTGPGHSVILSGIPPAISGIVGNDWYNSSLGRTFYCVEDSTVYATGINSENPSGKMSPHNFNGESFCDMLRLSSHASKAVGIALKDRGAILPVGKHPTGAFWFETKKGRWISSSYYDSILPQWVTVFNARNSVQSYLGKEWHKLLPEDAYVRSGSDSAIAEGNLPGETTCIFPHHVYDPANPEAGLPRNKYKRFEPFVCTPYGNDLTVDFAEAAITGEHLGQREVPDLLSISFSSPDYCGHIFGPDSHEMEDMMVRLDRQLSGFFHFVDSTIGIENTLIVLTADHGVAPIPERTAARGGLRLSAADYLNDIKVRIGQMYNYNEGNDNLIRSFISGSIYIDSSGLSAHHIPMRQFERDIAQITNRLPGIAACYTREQLLDPSGEKSFDSIQVKVKCSFHVNNSGDIMVVQKPYCIFGDKDVAVHGSPYWYDCNVPLIFYGKMFKPGNYQTRCSPLDIAPTLAKIFSISPPAGCAGQPLTESFVK